jgi:hypothetical protein
VIGSQSKVPLYDILVYNCDCQTSEEFILEYASSRSAHVEINWSVSFKIA